MLLLAGCAAPPAEVPPGTARHMVMVSIDTLRADHLAHMRFLQEWQQQARWAADLEQCANWTYPSVVCTLTGRTFAELGFLPQLAREVRAPLPPEAPLLAERLQAEGFHTLLVTANGWLSGEWGTDQGYVLSEPASPGPANHKLARGLTRLRLRLEEPDPPARWFLHVHVTEPHAPYDPPAEYLGDLEGLAPLAVDLTDHGDVIRLAEGWADLPEGEKAQVLAHVRVRYRAEVAWLDDQLAAFWADVRREPWFDDTLFVLWTDHGEQLGERGALGHAYGLGAEEARGWLALRGPGQAPGPVDGPSHAVDLVPTVLDALGLPPDPQASGFALGQAPADRVRGLATVGRDGPLAAVVKGDHKLVYRWDDGARWLYDRGADPAEQLDLYDPDHPVARDLEAALQEQVERLSELIAEPPVR